MLSLRFLATATLCLSLALVTAQPARANAEPVSTEIAMQRLTKVANLSPAQLPAVRKATKHYLKELTILHRQQFASAAEKSAAYTVAEYSYSQALQLVLSPAQMAAYRQLDFTARLVEIP